MKKSVLLAAVLAAMVLVAAAPAVAQVSLETEQGVESGTATQDFTISGGGDSANQCAMILGAAQTGNAANSAGALQADGDEDEIEVEDNGSLTISPALAEKCEQEINQTAVAASPKAEAAKAEAPKSAPAPKAETKTAKTSEGKGKATQAKAEAKTGEKKELPKTGGGNSRLFVLGIGALLVAGGLLARVVNR